MRVKEVADKVIAAMQGQDPITKDHITSSVDHYAQGNVHYKSSDESKREFLIDITKEVKKVIRVTPKKKPFRAKNNDEFLYRISMLIQEAAGQAFPDGDPFDYITDNVARIAKQFAYTTYKDREYGGVADIDDTPLMDILDAAAKKHLDVKDYHAYNEQLWQDQSDMATFDYDTDVKRETAKAQEHLPYGASINVDSLKGVAPLPNYAKNKNPWKESFNEAMEKYDNNIQLAIAHIGQVPEDEARELALRMSIDDYLNFIIAVDKDDDPVARNILNHYLGGLPLAYEAVAQEMHYMIRNKEPYVISPDFKKLHEMDQRKVLAEMTSEGMKKILANLRGYEHPGTYEASVFTVQINEDIIRLIKNMKIDTILEISGNAPGAAAQAAAYGGGDTSSSTTGATGKKMARFQNDDGEEESGEVVSQDSRSTTVRTKKGITKKMDNDAVFVSEKVLADIIRLAGIKKK